MEINRYLHPCQTAKVGNQLLVSQMTCLSGLSHRIKYYCKFKQQDTPRFSVIETDCKITEEYD